MLHFPVGTFYFTDHFRVVIVAQASTRLTSAIHRGRVPRIASRGGENCSSCAGKRWRWPTYASQRDFESILKHILAAQRDFSCEMSKKYFTPGTNSCLHTHCHDMVHKFESLPGYLANSSGSV